MSFCARCDFQSDDLAEHAADSGHWLCICCAGSLRQDEPVTCERCITKAREHLSVIVDCYALLPEIVTIPPGASSWGVRASGSDEQPIPGGDATVLLSNGSAGSWAQGEAHNIDHYPSDPPSVAYELSRWEDDWRQLRGDPAASTTRNPAPVMPQRWWLKDAIGPLSLEQLVGDAWVQLADGLMEKAKPTIVETAGYLEVHTRWAANNHPAFDEYMSDLRRLRGRLEAVTGMSRRPIRDREIACFDCGEHELVREWTDQGFEDDWTCRACHRRYDQASYWLAMRAKLEAKGAG